MPRLPKVKSDVPKEKHTYIDCPFCDKEHIRRDHYPEHLRTEMRRLALTSIDSVHTNLKQTCNATFVKIGSNILARQDINIAGEFQYPIGVCFDCLRPVTNSVPGSASNMESHDCDYRKRKPDVIQHIAPVLSTTVSDQVTLQEIKTILTSWKSDQLCERKTATADAATKTTDSLKAEISRLTADNASLQHQALGIRQELDASVAENHKLGKELLTLQAALKHTTVVPEKKILSSSGYGLALNLNPW